MERKGKCKSCKGKHTYIFYFSNAEHTHKISKRKELKKSKTGRVGKGEGENRKRREKEKQGGMKESGNVVEGEDIHVQRKKGTGR